MRIFGFGASEGFWVHKSRCGLWVYGGEQRSRKPPIQDCPLRWACHLGAPALKGGNLDDTEAVLKSIFVRFAEVPTGADQIPVLLEFINSIRLGYC